MTQKKVILLNITGEDKPGLTASLTQVLADYNIDILDIGQSVIHDHLALGMLFELPEASESSPVLKDILFKAHELDVQIKFTPISEAKYEQWVKLQGKERYIISLLSPMISASQLSRVSAIIAGQGLNIDQITRLSGRVSLRELETREKSCVEFSVRGKPGSEIDMRRLFMETSGELSVDIAFQEDNLFRRNRRLVCFDMDSTLIQTEIIVELAKRAGVGEQVSAITESAMRGEIGFRESFVQRVELLKGLDESVMKEIAENLPVTSGAERLFKTLHRYGYKTAILSGGFTYFGKHLQRQFDIDYVFSNELEIRDRKLTGRHLGEIVDGEMKAELLKKIAFKEEIHLEQAVAVGDGANDLPMLSIAGLGIAFHAKPKVKENAQQAISTTGLDGILYLMGFRDREIEGLS